jgi:hypothetical protein
MSCLRLVGTVRVDLSLEELALAYQQEVAWSQGYRINTDARLLLLGVQRLLAAGFIHDAALRTCAVVLGCRLGAMDSYEAFADSLTNNQATPLAFAYALPSMPLAGVSVRHAMRGMTYTLTGDNDIGLKALRLGAAQLADGYADMGIVGCWDTPSRTAQGLAPGLRCRLQLAVLQSAKEGMALPLFDYDADACASEADCVHMLTIRLKALRALQQQTPLDAKACLI